MTRPTLTISGLLMIKVALSAQDDAPTAYVLSLRKGATRSTEDKFETRLTPADSTYRERIKDTAGSDRYELTITPQAGGAKKASPRGAHNCAICGMRFTAISCWSRGEPSPDPNHNLWWLDPNGFGLVPIRTRRIVNVEGF